MILCHVESFNNALHSYSRIREDQELTPMGMAVCHKELHSLLSFVIGAGFARSTDDSNVHLRQARSLL